MDYVDNDHASDQLFFNGFPSPIYVFGDMRGTESGTRTRVVIPSIDQILWVVLERKP